VIGAVNIARPHLRLSEARMRELAPKLLDAARELSVAMVTKCSPPAPLRRARQLFGVSAVRCSARVVGFVFDRDAQAAALAPG
jgi:hypothetical protein